MSQDLHDIIEDAKEELGAHVDALDSADRAGFLDQPHDWIAECADGSGPVYTAELMELAAKDIELATTEPELGPAFDGSPTPANIIAANVYEAVTNALHEEARRLLDLERES